MYVQLRIEHDQKVMFVKLDVGFQNSHSQICLTEAAVLFQESRLKMMKVKMTLYSVDVNGGYGGRLFMVVVVVLM